MVADIEATKEEIFIDLSSANKLCLVSGMVYACNVEGETKAGGSEFKASIVYIANLSRP